MESSKIFGEAEECQSSESGWTMYIGSPIHSDDDDDGGHSNEGDSDDVDDTDANHGNDSDDSMASDASSGMAHSKHEEVDKDDGKCTTGRSDKKAKRQMGKQLQKDQTMIMKKKEKKEQKMMFGGSTTPARSDSKVRKNVWMGKRK